MTGSFVAAPPADNSNFTRTLSSTSPLNTYQHNSLRALKTCERMILFRNNSLKRSFKKINNESYFPHPHHCTIELKTKAASCLHLLPHHKTPPVVLSTFRNQSDNEDDQQKNNELLWRYQYDISKTNASHSQCNLNNVRHSHNNNVIVAETKFNNPLENKTIL